MELEETARLAREAVERGDFATAIRLAQQVYAGEVGHEFLWSILARAADMSETKLAEQVGTSRNWLARRFPKREPRRLGRPPGKRNGES